MLIHVQQNNLIILQIWCTRLPNTYYYPKKKKILQIISLRESMLRFTPRPRTGCRLLFYGSEPGFGNLISISSNSSNSEDEGCKVVLFRMIQICQNEKKKNLWLYPVDFAKNKKKGTTTFDGLLVVIRQATVTVERAWGLFFRQFYFFVRRQRSCVRKALFVAYLPKKDLPYLG